MGDQALSQDEIDALLQGSDEIFEDASPGMMEVGDSLNGDEVSSLKNIFSEITDSQSATLSTLFQKEVSIGIPTIDIITKDQFMDKIAVPFLEISIPFQEVIVGDNMYFYSETDALKIGSIMMGQEAAELTEMIISAVAESTSQMIGTTVTAFSNKYKVQIKTGSPQQIVVRNYTDALLPLDDTFAFLTYNLKIDNFSSKLYQVMSLSCAKSIVSITSPSFGQTAAPKPEAAKPSQTSFGGSSRGSAQESQFQTAQFSKLEPMLTPEEKKNISLLLDVQMDVTVELGRTKKTIKEILSMGEGTIVELDRLAGESVDLLVNGKKVAKGEVIVIEENFGLRITEILSKSERLNTIS